MTEDRYERLTAIDWWDGTLIRGARAIVAGAGALGNEVVKNLVLLGWGTVVVVDRDVVEASNLTRSLFFNTADVGDLKAPALAESAMRLNPDSRVLGLAGDLRAVLSAGLVQRADLVFGCLDNLGARVALSQLARRAGRLMIDGGLTTWEGTVQLFAPDSPDAPAACFACGLTEDDVRQLTLRHSCLAYERRALAAGGVPTTPTVTSAVAAMMVQEAVKWLHRDRHELPVAVGREMRIDLAHGRFWNHALTVNESCELHWEQASPEAGAAVQWNDSWQDILKQCRAAAAIPDGVLQLPVRLLLRWQCPACGASDEAMHAYAADGPLPCAECGQDAIPTFAAHVDGSEDWADRSPLDMDMPPWSWLELRAEGVVRTFELAGVQAPLDLFESDSDLPGKA